MSLELLTIDEVASLLRVSRDVVYRLANDGDLVGRKIGRAWRFPRQRVEEYAWARSTDSHSSTQRAQGSAESGRAAKVNSMTETRTANTEDSSANTEPSRS